jgi:hypothetical protein
LTGSVPQDPVDEAIKIEEHAQHATIVTEPWRRRRSPVVSVKAARCVPEGWSLGW